MPDINLDYLNDRYLAFALPMELRRLVGQGVRSWFGAGNVEERKHFKENYDETFPNSIPDLAAELKSAIRKFTSLVECWDICGSSQEKLRDCSKALTSAIDGYVKTLKADWYDARHRCYMKIANYYREYDQIPRRLRSWDLLGTHHLDHDENGIKGGNRIIIKNRSGDVIDDLQIKKRSAAPVISAIKTVGWYNAERQVIGKATVALMDCLIAPHRQLFELGSLLADVHWGKAWFAPSTNPSSRKAVTEALAQRVERLVCQHKYLFPDAVMPILKLLRVQDSCSSASRVTEQVYDHCHSSLYRARHGIVDCEYECQLLAFDLYHLMSPTLGNEQKVDVYARGSKFYADLTGTQPPTVNDFVGLAGLARRHRPRWVQIQIGYKSSQSADQEALKPLEIWDVLKIKKKDSAYIVLANEHIVCELEDDAGILFKYLLQAKGQLVTGPEIATKLHKKEFKVSRAKGTMPPEILALIKSEPRNGSSLKKHTDLKDCRFLMIEAIKPN